MKMTKQVKERNSIASCASNVAMNVMGYFGIPEEWNSFLGA